MYVCMYVYVCTYEKGIGIFLEKKVKKVPIKSIETFGIQFFSFNSQVAQANDLQKILFSVQTIPCDQWCNKIVRGRDVMKRIASVLLYTSKMLVETR